MSVVESILRQRISGRISCQLVSHGEGDGALALADRAVESVGLRPLGEGWLEISEADAEAVATGVLHRDLAYHAEVMPLAAARDLASELIALVPPPMRCFTNGDWADAFGDGEDEPHDGVSFDPISDASFDAGVICVGDGVTAVLWVEDED
jgi:hypothetical protein